MMKTILLSLLAGLLIASCSFDRARTVSEPPFPQKVAGWKYREENGVSILGEFVLRKGESTNNKEIQITLVELIPASRWIRQGAEGIDRAKLQFRRMSDKKVVCEETYPALTGSCGTALSEFLISGVGVEAINVKEQWVHFIVTGAQK
jgi:hypothetical protein